MNNTNQENSVSPVNKPKSRNRRRKKTAPASRPKEGTLRFIPLGGLGEIGKNMYLLEFGDDIMIIDCGLMFPDDEMLGIDFVIPDTSYLEANKSRIRGVFLTHGHEDHVGALPFVLPGLDVPLYGTKLTLGMASHRLSEARPDYKPKFMEIKAGDTVKAGCFSVSFIAVCHSIPDGVALAVETPLGTVVHTGDFKLDPTPVDGRVTDYNAFAELGKKGVLLMMSDSTNVEKEGFTQSESTISVTLERLFREHRTKRMVISSFSSNLHRIQQVVDAAGRFNRKVVFAGRSMLNNVDLARRLGYLKVEDDMMVPLQEIDKYPPNRIVLVTTGSQGETFSGLVLMSKGEHHRVKLGPKDVVAVFATPIPGNEKMVSNTVNRLFRCKCEVIYEKNSGTHVSGHASRDELKIMLSMVRPTYFVPVHGEYRMQVRHAQLASQVGVPSRNTFVMDNGDVLTITDKGAHAKSKVQAGAVLVDGLAFGELESSVMRERKVLAEEGVMVVSLTMDKRFKLLSDPTFESCGFMHLSDAENMRREFVDAVRHTVKKASTVKGVDLEVVENKVVSRCRELLRKYTGSSPKVIPMITVMDR
ncbi:ribonuclease J [Dethiosulfovibrio salsuginis]|uniref:Ribonuclease J n=1 Tax=Dethiosulfovibrio salsuginis TaxID=561720 RepID=A0A1X7K573_9BACT|nr:ribonuclease J [Dethiosulfovibrio salsuginis]SMG36132.1 ribonuclease J [Dethiosulfovibrio salsuginis]